MKVQTALAAALILFSALPATAGGKKKKVAPRAMLERMESVPCGAKQRGLNGLGSIWASVGITAVNSNEKLCPQYLLRTDEMDYEVRPKDTKHAEVMPIGQEVEIKLKKDQMQIKIPDGGKTVSFLVVAQRPASTDAENTSGRSSDRP